MLTAKIFAGAAFLLKRKPAKLTLSVTKKGYVCLKFHLNIGKLAGFSIHHGHVQTKAKPDKAGERLRMLSLRLVL